jgi:Starch-binding associating with outer membrane
MKNILLYTGIGLLLTGTGCKKFIDVNQNKNQPLTVQESVLLGPIEYSISHGTDGPGSATFDGEGDVSTYAQHIMQTICYNQVPINYGTYQFVSTDFNITWSNIYNNGLINLKTMIQEATADGNSNYKAIGEILTAYELGFATDMWGDIPYSKALNGASNYMPAYDPQASVYDSIQALLTRGIADAQLNAGVVPGPEDFFYNGKMAEWVKLAYSLEARYDMHLTKAPGMNATTQSNLALTALQNGMTAPADAWKFGYPGGSTSQNPWYTVMLPLSTLVASQAIIDTLQAHNDPRLPMMIAPAQVSGTDTGRPIGYPTIGNLNAYSNLGPFYASVGSTQYLMPYSEVLFIEAEANFRVSGVAAAQPYFTQAITANMQLLGVASGDITTYLAARGTLTAGDALEQIMNEKRIADFLSPENYNDWRRTGFPTLQIVPNAQQPGIPRRMLYPQSEVSTNPQPQQSATMQDRVWWDAQ